MKVRVLQGTAPGRRRTPLEDAYDQFRLERQGNRLSPRTLASYDYHVDGFFGWLHAGHPDVRQFKDLTIDVMRAYRAEMASRDSQLRPTAFGGDVARLPRLYARVPALGGC